MTDQQKKWARIAGLVIAIYYLVPWAFNNLRYMFSSHNPPPIRRQIPAAPVPKKPAIIITGIDPSDTAELTKFAHLPGNWRGSGMIQNTGMCTRQIQLKLSAEKPGSFTADTTQTCNISLALMNQKISRQAMVRDTQNAMTPSSAIMTGQVVSGDIHLTADKTIGVPPNGCVISAMTITPFADQIAVQWEENPTGCAGGRMILRRFNGPF